jgi:V/A-type H+-transporting ATPase subunit E
MEAEQVIEKILAEAEAEAGKIREKAREKEAAEQAQIDEQLAEYKKQTEILSQKAAESKKLHLLATARMQIAKDFLAEKRKILDEVFTQAREQILNLPDDQYRQLIINLMLKAVETGDEEVIIDKNERRIDQQLIDQVNERLRSNPSTSLRTGSKGNLKLSDKRQNIKGGFILKRGKIKNNVSLDVLLAQGRRDLEIELAKELFSV